MYAIVGISRLRPGATPDVVKNILADNMPADDPMEIESAEVCEVVTHA